MLTKKLIVLAAVVGVHGHAVMQDPEPRKVSIESPRNIDQRVIADDVRRRRLAQLT